MMNATICSVDFRKKLPYFAVRHKCHSKNMVIFKRAAAYALNEEKQSEDEYGNGDNEWRGRCVCRGEYR